MSETVRYDETKHRNVRKRTWLASGEVTYQVRWTAKDGKRKSATRDTLREARDFRDEMFRHLRLGGSADPSASRITYGENWERWYPTKDIEQSTRDTELSYFRNHIEPHWAYVRLCDITPFTVEAWLLKLRSTVPTDATRLKIYQIFSQPLRLLVERGVLLANPLAGVKPPKVEKVEARFLEDYEWQWIEDAIHPHWRLVVPFSIDTGLRIGEVAAVCVCDLDFVDLSVRVRKTASVAKGKRVEGRPKSAAGLRTVPMLSEPVAEALAEMIEQRGLGPNDHVFTGPRGGLMTPSNWRTQIWNPAVERAGIHPHATPHALRHTAISSWIEADANVAEVKTWAGHSSVTITVDTYGHLFKRDAAGIRQRIEANRRARQSEGT